MEALADPGALADLLARGGGYGVAAVLVLAWIFERRQNQTLQSLLLQLSTGELKAKESTK